MFSEVLNLNVLTRSTCTEWCKTYTAKWIHGCILNKKWHRTKKSLKKITRGQN